MKTSNDQYIHRLLAGMVAFSLLSGCGSSDNDSVSAQPQFKDFYGTWDRSGYGDALVIDSDGGRFYQYTQSGCIMTDHGNNADTAALLGKASLSGNGNTLAIPAVEHAVFKQQFTRIANLPAQCNDAISVGSASATQVFDSFQQTYADYYAFFDIRGVDWNAQIAKASLVVSDGMGDEALFSALAQALAPIDDGHVQLAADDSRYRPVSVRGANRVVEQTFPLQETYPTIDAYGEALNNQYWEILGSYLDEGSVASADGALPDRMIWATLRGGRVGYLLINSMAYFAEADEGLDPQANVDRVHALMPQLLAALGNTEALIIDIRSNAGGQDDVAFAIAAYFTAERRRVGAKYSRSFSGEGPLQEAWLEPVEGYVSPYLNPVAVITSDATASAAETFTLTMKALPRVIQVGESTAGMMSDVLEKTLPNGWEIWLANEVYLDANGVSHEGTGITPDIQASAFSLDAMEQGRNAALDGALTALGF